MSSPDVPMGDRFIARLIGNSGTETGTAVREIISDLSGTGTSSTKSVLVVTGEEIRPNATTVFWIGGTTQPTNMGADDLWFSPTGTSPAGDTTPPSAPTGLASSGITSTGFTLSWTASTDNSAVTGYAVYLNGVLTANTSVNSADITGLTANTAYTVSVKAKDAANNISAASSDLQVTTASVVSGTAQHSIWGSDPYPWTIAKDTGSPITVANSFYSYGTSPDVSAWRIVGAKVWIPAGATTTGPLAVSLWRGNNAQLETAPEQTASIASLTAGQWNTVYFPAAAETSVGETFKVGYRYPNGDYFGIGSPQPGGYITATDGSHIVLASDSDDFGRSSYLYDGGTTNTSNSGYGIDVIYDEGP